MEIQQVHPHMSMLTCPCSVYGGGNGKRSRFREISKERVGERNTLSAADGSNPQY